MGRKNGWLVGLALFLVSPLAFVQAQRVLEEQLAGVRLGAPFIDYDEEGRLKPDCLLAIYGMPTYFGVAPAQPSMMPSTPEEDEYLKYLRLKLRLEEEYLRLKLKYLNPEEELRELEKYSGDMIIFWPIEPLIKAWDMEAAVLSRKSSLYNDIIKSYTAGKISAEQANELMKKIQKESEEEIKKIRAVTEAVANLRSGLKPSEGSKGAVGTTEVAPPFPHPEELPWVIPPFVKLNTNEFYFVYCRHRQGAHLNFLVKLTGTEGRKEFRVVAITVAGRRYDGAQTAKGDPFKSIKLGDDLQRVLLRYGLPDEIVYYNPLTLQVVNTPTRNLILRYHLTRNIEFTILGDKVVRIFIFLPGQVTFNRR
jgi:hypothetical protein